MPVSLHQAVLDFLAARTADGLSPRTIDTYKTILRPLVEALGHVAVDEVTAADMQRYVAALRTQNSRYRDSAYHPETPGPLSVETVRSRITSLKVFWRWCVLAYDLPASRDPMRGVRLPRSSNVEPKAIDPLDIRKLIEACTDDLYGLRDRAVIYFLADTGCRAGGVVSLRREDLDLEHRRARVHEKGDKSRWVPFSGETAEVLREWLAQRPAGESDTVFCALGPWASSFDRGEALTTRGLYGILKRLANRAGVARFNPHSFRHGFAHEALRRGARPLWVAQVLGHSNLGQVMRYGKLWSDELAEEHEQYSPVKHLNDTDLDTEERR